MKDILGLIKYLLIMTSAAFLSQIPYWLFDDTSKFNEIFPQINNHSIIGLALSILIVIYFIKLSIDITKQAIKNHWSKYLDYFFNNFFLMTLILILIHTGSKIYEPGRIINILNLHINVSYISSLCSYIFPAYFIIYLIAVFKYPSKEITNAPKFVIQLNKMPKWVILIIIKMFYDTVCGCINAIIALICITLLSKIRYIKISNLALPANLAKLTRRLPIVSSPYMKDLIGLIKYLLIMLLVTIFPLILYGLFALVVVIDEFFHKIPENELYQPAIMPSSIIMIFIWLLLSITIIVYYFILPINCTKQAIKNHWSKYLDYFFNNFFLMTLPLILICKGLEFMSGDIPSFNNGTLYILAACLLIFPVYLMIYITALLTCPTKEITNAPKFVILLNKIPKLVILIILALIYSLNISYGYIYAIIALFCFTVLSNIRKIKKNA